MKQRMTAVGSREKPQSTPKWKRQLLGGAELFNRDAVGEDEGFMMQLIASLPDMAIVLWSQMLIPFSFLVQNIWEPRIV